MNKIAELLFVEYEKYVKLHKYTSTEFVDYQNMDELLDLQYLDVQFRGLCTLNKNLHRYIFTYISVYIPVAMCSFTK